MKVVHIECGLGNQMLDYCEYLALRHARPGEAVYLETLTFDIPECAEIFSQWYGYELERVFGIKTPNVRQLFTDGQWERVLAKVKSSRFWLKYWNWPVYFCEAFRSEGLELANVRGDFEKGKIPAAWSHQLDRLYRLRPVKWLCRLYQITLYNYGVRPYKLRNQDKFIRSEADMLFYKGAEDALLGHRLSFQKRNNQIELIDGEIRRAFTFPPFADEQNRSFSEFITSREAVAIHVRRGDMLRFNSRYYNTGYFRRAVRFIKERIKEPVFIFFCDPESHGYCRKELKAFSLEENDEVRFADWNTGEESYRDMQLMSLCKHNIITNSSFGWWGAYLNQNPGKITISPEVEINTTHHL